MTERKEDFDHKLDSELTQFKSQVKKVYFNRTSPKLIKIIKEDDILLEDVDENQISFTHEKDNVINNIYTNTLKESPMKKYQTIKNEDDSVNKLNSEKEDKEDKDNKDDKDDKDEKEDDIDLNTDLIEKGYSRQKNYNNSMTISIQNIEKDHLAVLKYRNLNMKSNRNNSVDRKKKYIRNKIKLSKLGKIFTEENIINYNIISPTIHLTARHIDDALRRNEENKKIDKINYNAFSEDDEKESNLENLLTKSDIRENKSDEEDAITVGFGLNSNYQLKKQKEFGQKIFKNQNYNIRLHFKDNQSSNTISPYSIFSLEYIQKSKPIGGLIYWTDRMRIKHIMSDNYILIKPKNKNKKNKNMFNLLKDKKLLEIEDFEIVTASLIDNKNYEDSLFMLEKSIPEKNETETILLRTNDCFYLKHFKTGFYLSFSIIESALNDPGVSTTNLKFVDGHDNRRGSQAIFDIEEMLAKKLKRQSKSIKENQKSKTSLLNLNSHKQVISLSIKKKVNEMEIFTLHKLEQDSIWEINFIKHSFCYLKYYININNEWDRNDILSIYFQKIHGL